MKIAVDMENVLADPKTWFLEVYNDRNGTAYTIADVDHWDWVQTEIEFDEFMETIDEGWRSYHDEINPLGEDIGKSLRELSALPDVTVDIVTARTGVESEMRAWLERHGATEYEEFLSIEPFETKATLGYEYYIDDNPKLAADLQAHQTQFLVTWPWNQSARDHPRTVPIGNVSDAVAEINKLVVQ